MKNYCILVLLLVSVQSCEKETFETKKYNSATEWQSDFNYLDIKNQVESQYVDGIYNKQLPVGEKWTYATIQPDASQIELIDNNYIRCYTAPENGLTSKAQVVRKFAPYGILDGYNGITAFNPTDVVTITMDMYLNGDYLTDGNVYFLDFEDSMSKSTGIRFFIYNNTAIGVNIDKIRNNNTVFYTETPIPTNTWFSFKLELLIGVQGNYKIWIDNNLVFNIDEQSYDEKLNFYDAVMTGITGTIKDAPSEVWIDNFYLQVNRGDY
ncbi:MAG: hypothetical protein PHW82_13760 [Bacteroidales bacterium]|nr:hypothetical protein [Bacteroidales bacterium]